MVDLVGSANAYKYTGPLQPEPLIKYGEEVLRKLASPVINPRNEDPLTVIAGMSDQLFQLRYNQGSETT